MPWINLHAHIPILICTFKANCTHLIWLLHWNEQHCLLRGGFLMWCVWSDRALTQEDQQRPQSYCLYSTIAGWLHTPLHTHGGLSCSTHSVHSYWWDTGNKGTPLKSFKDMWAVNPEELQHGHFLFVPVSTTTSLTFLISSTTICVWCEDLLVLSDDLTCPRLRAVRGDTQCARGSVLCSFHVILPHK